MKAGYLSDFFGGVGWKRLSGVEVDPNKSNQSEFNGSKPFVRILGTQERRIKKGTGIPAQILFFKEDTEVPLEHWMQLSWYDSRGKGFYPNARQKKREPEYRLFYQRNPIVGTGVAKEGDLLIIAFDKDLTKATVIIAEKDSTFESQLLWLFGIEAGFDGGFEIQDAPKRTALDFAATQIVESLGIIVPVKDDVLLEKLLRNFGEEFPSSIKFSEFARQIINDVNAVDDCDSAIIRWMEQEEIAFRVLEKYLVEKRLQTPFSGVDDFVSYSLSVQNRRKARAGAGFENHLNAAFIAHDLKFTWKGQVENKAKPDFLFPGVDAYWNDNFPVGLLTLLGAKTSCKDRWRQVLSEGKRVERKHLVTLEPAISSTQLLEMSENRLQLIVPAEIQQTYRSTDRAALWSLSRFVEFVRANQMASGY